MNQIDYITKEECCGCMACVSSCPYDAIDIQVDDEGFYHPVINREKCKKLPDFQFLYNNYLIYKNMEYKQ